MLLYNTTNTIQLWLTINRILQIILIIIIVLCQHWFSKTDTINIRDFFKVTTFLLFLPSGFSFFYSLIFCGSSILLSGIFTITQSPFSNLNFVTVKLTVVSTVLVSFSFNDPSLDCTRICTSE